MYPLSVPLLLNRLYHHMFVEMLINRTLSSDVSGNVYQTPTILKKHICFLCIYSNVFLNEHHPQKFNKSTCILRCRHYVLNTSTCLCIKTPFNLYVNVAGQVYVLNSPTCGPPPLPFSR